MSKDSVGDFLTIVRNGIMASKPSVEAPYSKIRFLVAQILKREGFVADVAVHGEGAAKKIQIFLRYVGGESAIHEIKRVSTPGRRVYARCNELKPVVGGLGVAILTTSRGLLTNKKAKELSLGGEVICTVW
jgi:small subunit ribosomal protein S8